MSRPCSPFSPYDPISPKLYPSITAQSPSPLDNRCSWVDEGLIWGQYEVSECREKVLQVWKNRISPYLATPLLLLSSPPSIPYVPRAHFFYPLITTPRSETTKNISEKQLKQTRSTAAPPCMACSQQEEEYRNHNRIKIMHARDVVRNT